jgi:membrane protein implicated in regulation of membrane protease activity
MLSSFWLWLILAGILFIFEMFTVSTYALCIAIGAVVTGLIFLVIPSPSLFVELIVFAVLSALSLYMGMRYFSNTYIHTTNVSMLNQRGNQYISQIYTLEENIINGRAHLKISDTVWQIESNVDLPVGTTVRVIAVKGNKLVVESI